MEPRVGARLFLSSAAPVGILAAALPRFQKRREGQVSSSLALSLKTKWPATGTTLRAGSSDEGSKSPCVPTRSIKSKRESPFGFPLELSLRNQPQLAENAPFCDDRHSPHIPLD
jgi:hypothetical protein